MFSKFKASVASAILLFAVPTFAQDIPPSDACQANCVYTTEIGGDYFVVARGFDGQVVAIEPIDGLPAGLRIREGLLVDSGHVAGFGSDSAEAVAFDEGPSDDPETFSGSMTESVIQRYETATQWVIVIPTVLRDVASGEVLDLAVSVQQIGKPASDG